MMVMAFQELRSRQVLITPQNTGPLANIVAWFLIVAVVLAVITRISIKRFTRSDKVSYEDYAVVGATVLASVIVVLISRAVDFGLGRPRDLVDGDSRHRLEKLQAAIDALYVVTVALTKYATIQLLVRLGAFRQYFGLSYWIHTVTAVLWAVVGVITIGAQCGGGRSWDAAPGCINIISFWEAMETVNITTELSLCLLPIWLVWGLQMNFSRKIVVVVAFALRTSVIGAIIARLVELTKDNQISRSGVIGGSVPSTNATQCVIAFAIITACTPVLKPFLDNFTSGVLGASLKDTSQATTSFKDSYKLRSLRFQEHDRLRSSDGLNNGGHNGLLEHQGPPYSLQDQNAESLATADRV